MENTPLSVFVLGDHALVLNGLRRMLQQKFGSTMHVETFCDVHSCLRKMDSFTHVLVIDETVEGRTAGEWAAKFRAISPQIEIVTHRNSDQVLQKVRTMLHQRLLPEAASVFALV